MDDIRWWDATSQVPAARSTTRYAWRYAATVAILAALLAGAVTMAVERYGHLGQTLRDPIAIAHAGSRPQFYAGWLTYVGVLAWAAGAAVAIFAAALVGAAGRRRAALLATGGILSAAFAIDDLFMVHDLALSSHGVPEEVTLLLLGTTCCWWAAVYRRDLAVERNLPVLALAGVFLGFSVLADTAEPRQLLLNEEAAKLAGALCWSIWLWTSALVGIREVPG